MAEKYFNILRGITMASALHGAEKKELLEFINKVEGSLNLNETDRLDG